MDPGLAFSEWAARPAAVDAHAAIFAGAVVPVVVPLDCLPADVRAKLLLGREDAPIDARIAAALGAGQEDAAWAELSHLTLPLSAPRLLDTTLALWVARESARLQLPATRAAALVVGDAATGIGEAASGSVADVQALLQPWPWPRWIGPVVVVSGDAGLDGFPATQRLLVRPALPMIRIPARLGNPRPAIASATCALALRLTAPPTAGWPPWFERGLCAYAAARSGDAFVSPRRMQEARQAAGAAAIAALLTAPEPDEALAMAVCVPLLHPNHQSHLSALMDLLRNGAGSEGALRIAYGFTPETLLTER